MYKTRAGYPVQKFCNWYNEKYDSNLVPDNIEYELSASELDYLSELFANYMANRFTFD